MADADPRPARRAADSAEATPVATIDRVAALHHLLKLNNRLMAPLPTHLEEQHRITVNEYRVLMLIGQLGVTASHELAAELGVNTMAVSRAVAALARSGHVAVAIDPQSRRRKVLELTGAGRALFAEMLPASVKVADYLFAALRPHEVLAFDHFVQALTRQLDAADERGESMFLREMRAGEDPRPA